MPIIQIAEVKPFDEAGFEVIGRTIKKLTVPNRDISSYLPEQEVRLVAVGAAAESRQQAS